jgi:energy-coupling factor transporter ATP-binding protein EcfA2
MKIDLTSIFFNSSLSNSSVGTPSWGTALGQSRQAGYPITREGAQELVELINANSKDPSSFITNFRSNAGTSIVKAAVISGIKVNGISLVNPLILMITEEHNINHSGRKSLKYNRDFSFEENGIKISNADFYQEIQSIFGNGACWFATDISVLDNHLALKAIKVSDEYQTYANSDERKNKWQQLVEHHEASISDNGDEVVGTMNENTLIKAFTEDCSTKSVQFSIDKSLALRFASSLLSKRFLILTGLSGSGKTKLAQAFSRWITSPEESFKDPFIPGSILKGARTEYKITAADRLSIEFLSDEGTKVLLPRAIISQWAEYIKNNNVPESIQSQVLRDKIKAEFPGEYSGQLQSFETHYKPAAFKLIEAESNSIIKKSYEVVPVGADWTGNENILGYPHGLEESKYVTKQALDLIHRAEETPDVPHFLILDEMNLSHVERYFADMLSGIESDEKIRLHHDEVRLANGRIVNSEISLPKNLFIIGTVNVDETTYMFSPKVLDRANVIEFRMDDDELASFLADPVKPDLDELDGKGASFGMGFVKAASTPSFVPADVDRDYQAEMLLFFKVLQAYGCEYGYRVAHEAARFMKFYQELGQGKVWDRSADGGKGSWVEKTPGGRIWFHDAFDALVVQKFLPKLNGSEAKLRKPLWALAHLCSEVRDWSGYPDEASRKVRINELAKNAKDKGESKSKDNDSPTSIASKLVDAGKQAGYPLSFAKIERMWRAAQTNGFTSFAESI